MQNCRSQEHYLSLLGFCFRAIVHSEKFFTGLGVSYFDTSLESSDWEKGHTHPSISILSDFKASLFKVLTYFDLSKEGKCLPLVSTSLAIDLIKYDMEVSFALISL